MIIIFKFLNIKLDYHVYCMFRKDIQLNFYSKFVNKIRTAHILLTTQSMELSPYVIQFSCYVYITVYESSSVRNKAFST